MGGPTDRSGIEYLCRLTKSPGKNVPDEGYTWLPGKTLHRFGHVQAEFIRKTEERKEDDKIAQGFAKAAATYTAAGTHRRSPCRRSRRAGRAPPAGGRASWPSDLDGHAAARQERDADHREPLQLQHAQASTATYYQGRR
jgi:hypothetical protein